jgi:parallel beta helix pectate lyase-like protein
MISRHRRLGLYARLVTGGVLLAIAGVLAGVDVRPGTATATTPPALARLPAQEPEPPGEEPGEPSAVEPAGPTEAERAAQRAAEQAAARAARRAALWADAAHKARRAWETHDKPHRMAVVRADRIEVVTEGRLSRQVTRAGPVTIAELDRALPGSWVEVIHGTALLGASVVITPGATFEVGAGIHTLKLLGGPSPQDAASIHTGGGSVALRNVSVTSADPVTLQPLPPTAPGRPNIVVSPRGRLDAIDASISDLGSRPVGIDDGSSGLVFSPGSSGSLVRTGLYRNTTGLELDRSEAVYLELVTISESSGDGLVLAGDRGTTMSGIRAVDNGQNGVIVRGERSDRPVTGIVTTGNNGFGVVVVGQVGTTISDVATATDQAGGLRISHSSDLHITNFSAVDQPTGVYTHVSSARIVLDRLRIEGGRRGIVAEKSTQGLEVRSSRIYGPRVTGVSIGGTNIALEDVQVSDARTGVRVERGASGVRIAGLVVNGVQDGILTTAGTTGLVIADINAIDVMSDAIRTATPNAEIIGGLITGGTTGIDVAASTTISGVTIDGAEEGIHSRSPEPVRVDNVAIDAVQVGVNAVAGSPLLLTTSSVHALQALRGDVHQRGENDLSLPPLNLLSAIGAPLILLAVVLEQTHSVRQRGIRHRTYEAPPAVLVGVG